MPNPELCATMSPIECASKKPKNPESPRSPSKKPHTSQKVENGRSKDRPGTNKADRNPRRGGSNHHH